MISCGKLKHRSGRMASLMTHDHNDSEYCKHLNVSTDGVQGCELLTWAGSRGAALEEILLAIMNAP